MTGPTDPWRRRLVVKVIAITAVIVGAIKFAVALVTWDMVTKVSEVVGIGILTFLAVLVIAFYRSGRSRYD